MEFLIALAVLVPIAILFLQIIITTKISNQQQSIDKLNAKVEKLTREIRNQQKQAPDELYKSQPATPPIEPAPVILPAPEPMPEEKPAAPVIEPPVINVTETPLAAETEPVESEEQPSLKDIFGTDIPPVDLWDDRMLEKQRPAAKPNWIPERENLEEFIGGNLANKIGIGVLVLGIAFFIKYAIDKDWISELGRVSIGLLCGALLIGLAHRTRHKYRAFSSVLMGGGLAVLYFSIAFAFQAYALISQQAAFIILLITTGFAVAMALYYNRQEIAILAALGGFATPFLVSTGQDNYVALFIYLLVLCAGITILSWFKKWPAVNIICLIGTSIIFGGWLVGRLFTNSDLPFPYQHALLFSTLFFLLFMAMHTLNNLRLRSKFAAGDFTLLLSTQLGYYAAGITAVMYMKTPNADALFTLSVSIFNGGLAWLFNRFTRVDRNFIWLLAGLSITLLTLFAFLQFDGHITTLFWGMQSVLLLFLFARTHYPLLFKSSVLLLFLSLISLLFVWFDRYAEDGLPILFNQAFVTTLGVSLALFALQYLTRRYQLAPAFSRLNDRPATALLVLSLVVLFVGGLLELGYQVDQRFPAAPVSMLYAQMYVYLLLLGLLFYLRKKSYQPFVLQVASLLVLFSYLFLLGLTIRVQLFLHNTDQSAYFIAHWISAILAGVLGWLFIRQLLTLADERWKDYRGIFSWLAVISFVALLSIELYHINYALYLSAPDNHPRWENLYFKAQLSILWGLSAFAMIWIGLRYKFQPLRLISLVLFTATLVKLFVYDIRNIPPGGKIASFILLGVLLLTISFMYQRIRAILVNDDSAVKPEEEKNRN